MDKKILLEKEDKKHKIRSTLAGYVSNSMFSKMKILYVTLTLIIVLTIYWILRDRGYIPEEYSYSMGDVYYMITGVFGSDIAPSDGRSKVSALSGLYAIWTWNLVDIIRNILYMFTRDGREYLRRQKADMYVATCSHCGQDTANRDFCQHCGNSLANSERHRIYGPVSPELSLGLEKRCKVPECDKPLNDGRYCPHCGKDQS
jgi:hypothetical protein